MILCLEKTSKMEGLAVKNNCELTNASNLWVVAKDANYNVE